MRRRVLSLRDLRSQHKKDLINISKLVLPVQHAICEARGCQQGNVKPFSESAHTQNIYFTLTASAESRQLQIVIPFRCQIYTHVHTSLDMFGILLHNHQHFSLWLTFTPPQYKSESIGGRDSAGRSEMNNSGLVTSTQTPRDNRQQHIDTLAEKLHSSLRVVNMHLIHQFGDR